MTLLVCWVGIDTHGPASIYIASDSRYSTSKAQTFDFGRKLFVCKEWPDIFGYCGDVLFPSVALGQITALADEGLLFDRSFPTEKKFSVVVEKLNDLLAGYPAKEFGLSRNGVTIIHASRCDDKEAGFSCNQISWHEDHGWRATGATMPKHSSVLLSDGSGKRYFDQMYSELEQGANSRTSRNVFHSFCESLNLKEEATVGGAPQLVGLIRKPGSVGENYGIIHNYKRYFLGAHIDNARSFDNISWRNQLFERCDGRTKKRFPNAQKQPLTR